MVSSIGYVKPQFAIVGVTPRLVGIDLRKRVAYRRGYGSYPKRTTEGKVRKRQILKETFLTYIPAKSCIPGRHPAYITRFSKLVRGIIAKGTIESITILEGIVHISIEVLIVISGRRDSIVIISFFLHFLKLYVRKSTIIT